MRHQAISMPYTRIERSTKQAIIDAYENENDYIEAARLIQVKEQQHMESFDVGEKLVRSNGHVRGSLREQCKKIDDEMKEVAV